VAFGGVWKQSLTELSGGQRSLLALSLILAMLLFKPAPIYILDEADPPPLPHTHTHTLPQPFLPRLIELVTVVIGVAGTGRAVPQCSPANTCALAGISEAK